jgi:2-methylcitrate dehydratase PrpD
MRDEFPADAIERITVTVTPTVEKMCRGKSVGTVVDAQMSLPYAVAIGALYGGAGIDLFEEDVRQRPEVRRLMERIDVAAGEGLPSNVAARVEILARDGRSATQAIDVPLGSPGNALSQEQLLAKFHSLATPVIGAARAQTLEQRIMKLGAVATAAGLGDAACNINDTRTP